MTVGKLSVIYKIKRSRIIYLSIISYGVRYVIFCRTDKIHHYERTRSYIISKATSFHPLGDTTMINAQKKEHATVFFFIVLCVYHSVRSATAGSSFAPISAGNTPAAMLNTILIATIATA